MEDIALERLRQIGPKRHEPEADDELKDGQLARAAAVYAMLGTKDAIVQGRHIDGTGISDVISSFMHLWPFGRPPTCRRRRRALVVAAALLVAEIERLDRQERQKQGN